MGEGIDFGRISYVLTLGIIGFVVIYSILSMSKAARPTYESEMRMAATVRDSVDRALVQCYALEGSYPGDLYYIRDNYGIVMDEQRFLYYYEAFGSNIKPDVIIIPLTVDAPEE